jgi:hypothetical protein
MPISKGHSARTKDPGTGNGPTGHVTGTIIKSGKECPDPLWSWSSESESGERESKDGFDETSWRSQ